MCFKIKSIFFFSQNKVSHITVIPEDARLRYAFSEPTVRILQRPSKSAGDGDGLVNGDVNKRVVKSLQQVNFNTT